MTKTKQSLNEFSNFDLNETYCLIKDVEQILSKYSHLDNRIYDFLKDNCKILIAQINKESLSRVQKP